MDNSIQFIQTSPEQLTDQISKAVEKQLSELTTKLLSKDANDELLTRSEACDLLQVDQSTLWHWQKKGRIQAYGIGNRRYYKRSELLSAIKPLKN
jgi:excisionase family DNA binding protein